MRILRSIAIAAHLIGILFKMLHWPGASVLLLSTSVLVILSLGSLLFRKPGPLTVQLQLPAMLVGAVMAAVTGGLFKVLHWPGANILLLLGLTTCATWFLITGSRQARSV